MNAAQPIGESLMQRMQLLLDSIFRMKFYHDHIVRAGTWDEMRDHKRVFYEIEQMAAQYRLLWELAAPHIGQLSLYLVCHNGSFEGLYPTKVIVKQVTRKRTIPNRWGHWNDGRWDCYRLSLEWSLDHIMELVFDSSS